MSTKDKPNRPISTMHLGRETVQELFQVGDAYTQQKAGTHCLTLECTVLERTACYFVNEREGSRIKLDPKHHKLESQVIHELGWKYIEHSRSVTGTSATLTVRCRRAVDADEEIECEVYRGHQWEHLPVSQHSHRL